MASERSSATAEEALRMDEVRDEETLGRACFDGHVKKKANQGYFRRSLRRHGGKLSVDRFEEDLSNIEYLTRLHDLEALNRDSGTFFGWHCLKAKVLRRTGASIHPSARKGADDDWHADIVAMGDQAEAVLAVIASEISWRGRRQSPDTA